MHFNPKHVQKGKKMNTNDLSGVSWHSPGHHPLQVAAQTHSLYSDDGLLGQDGAEDEEEVVGGVFNPPLLVTGFRGERGEGYLQRRVVGVWSVNKPLIHWNPVGQSNLEDKINPPGVKHFMYAWCLRSSRDRCIPHCISRNVWKY